MTEFPQFRFADTEPVNLNEVGWVSPHVRFVLDKTVIINPDEIIELANGEWFLINSGEKTQIEGKWDRVKQ